MQSQFDHLNIDPVAAAAVLDIQFPGMEFCFLRNSIVDNGSLNEVIKISRFEKKKAFTICVRNDHPYHKAIAAQIEDDEVSKTFYEILNAEFSRIAIDQYLYREIDRNDEHALLADLFGVPVSLDETEQQMLMYFIPYARQISEDLSLIQQCFYTIFDCPVTLEFGAAKTTEVTGVLANKTIVGDGAKLGGRMISDKKCLNIQMGPIPPTRIDEFVSGGQSRRFLEQEFCPRFLPPDCDWRILLCMEPPLLKIENRIQEPEALRVGIDYTKPQI